MPDVTELAHAHALVWRYRQTLERHWPTPGRIDCLRFAFTEAGEAMDALLRAVPTYARNNARNMSVPDELADCAMMLLSALPPSYQFTPVNVEYYTLDGICYEVAYAMLTGEVISALLMIEKHLAACYGVRLSDILTSRLERIKTKVLPA